MRRTLPVAIHGLVLALVLAGCAEDGSPETQEADPVDALELEATDTTGVLRGVVVDDAIRPLAGVLVELSGTGNGSVETSDDGVFGFQDLPPGTYFVKASRIGYFGAQQTVEVVAGVDDPPVVKVMLRRDVTYQAFVESRQYEGFIQCTSSVLVLCGIPNVLTGDEITSDRFAWDQAFADGGAHIQAEMVWDSTQALSPELYFEMEALNDACENSNDDVGRFLNNTSGPSPIYATVNATQIQAWSVGSTCPLWISVFSGGAAGTPVGFTVQQRFTMYFHTFVGYAPPSGWRFAIDGEPPQPPQ